ncbi:MAG: hypothetical protein IKC16_06415 [Clostridia bacterium]|nr:hypothetical protein [Clostridia bacterium]
MEFAKVLFGAGFDLLNLSPIVCGVVLGVCAIFAIVAALIRCQVVYVDTDGDYEIEYEKKKWLSKVVLRPASKQGKTFVGWSLDEKGETMVSEPEFLLTHTVVLYAIWADEKEAKAATEKADGVFVQLNYLDAEGEDIIKSTSVKVNTVLPEDQDTPINVKGWSFEKGGEIVLSGEDVNAVFAINLYPIFDPKAEANEDGFNGSAVVELLFVNSENDEHIYKESHYVDLNAPDTFLSSNTFIGWGVEANGEAIIEKGENDSVFTIQLFSVGLEKAEAEETPSEEAAIEAVEETPSEEAPSEEATEEVVEETPSEEVYEEAPSEEAVEEAPVEEAPVEEAPAEEIAPTIVPTYFDNEGNKIEIRYSRSFTANLIQSEDGVKDFYSQLKNHILSYKGVKSKISWKFDSYNRGRDQLFKLKLRGKTILLYCALDPEEFEKSKYHHESINAKIFADVPMLLKIKSGLGLRKAKEIVDVVMAKFGIEPNPKAKTVDYVSEYPYAETEALLEQKLVKALEADNSIIVKSSKEKNDEE